MNAQNDNSTTYEFQSFEHHPTAPMFPHGWDLSEMQSASEIQDSENSNGNEAN